MEIIKYKIPKKIHAIFIAIILLINTGLFYYQHESQQISYIPIFSTLFMLSVYWGFMLLWIRSRRSQETRMQEEIFRIHSARLIALGEMSSSIAHEINNPLTIIKLKLDFLTNMLKNKSVDYEKMQSIVGQADKTADRIAKIIQGVKSVSRNAENDPMTTVNLKTIVDDALEICTDKIKHRSIDLRLELTNIESIWIHGRSTQITQVLINIIGNAIEAINDLPEKWLSLNIQQVENEVIIKIIDSGNGIPDNIAKKLMTPFFTTKEVGKGTGLGLHISRDIITKHNGQFFYDQHSKNTCFVIKLPCHLKPAL